MVSEMFPVWVQFQALPAYQWVPAPAAVSRNARPGPSAVCGAATKSAVAAVSRPSVADVQVQARPPSSSSGPSKLMTRRWSWAATRKSWSVHQITSTALRRAWSRWAA